MSVKDLIANWEEALTVALSQPDEGRGVIELNDGDLETVSGQRIRSNVHAGPFPTTINSDAPRVLL